MAGELSIVSTEPDTTSANPLKVVSSAPVPKVTSDDVERVAKEYGVPADLAVAVAHIESRNDPLAKSNKGAQGVMQLMPDTATRYGVKDPYDPEQNIRGGVQYLRDLMKQFGGDRDKVLAAYNWGEHNVDKGKKLPAETEQYISDVNAKAKEHVRENLKVVSTEPESAQPLQVVSTEPDVPLQSMHGQKPAEKPLPGAPEDWSKQALAQSGVTAPVAGPAQPPPVPNRAGYITGAPVPETPDIRKMIEAQDERNRKMFEKPLIPGAEKALEEHRKLADSVDATKHPVIAALADADVVGMQTLIGLSTPGNVALLGSMALAPEAAAVKKMVDAGFSIQMAKAAYDQWKAGKEAYDKGDTREARRQWGSGAVSAFFAFLSGKGAVKGEPKVVGSEHEPVVAETDQTVQHQVEALKNGTIDTVMIPKGQTMPQVPEGMKSVTVDKGKGEGTYLYDPRKTNGDYIRQQAEAGKHGELLGHLQSKDELAGKDTVVVQAHAKDGTPIQDSEVENHPDQIEAQKAAMQRRHPDAEVTVKTPQEVLTARAGEAQEASEAKSGTQGPESEEWKSVPFYSEPYVEGENGFNRAWRLSDSPTSDDVVGDTTYRSKLTKGGEAVQVRAYLNGEEIGGASLDIDPGGEGKNFAESNDLSVKESERGKGVARQLYDNLPKIAKRYGVDTIQGERVKTEGGTGVWDSLVRDGKAYRTKDQYGQDVVRMGERPQEGPSLSEEHVRSILEKHPSISPEQVDSMFSVWRNYAEKYHGIPFDEYLNRAMRGEGFGVGGRYEGEEGLQQARRAGGDGVTWAYHPQKGILADRAGRKGHEQLLYEAGVDNMFGRAYDRMPRGRATVDPYSQQLVVTMQGEGDLSTSAERELRRSLDVPDNYTTRVVQSSSAPLFQVGEGEVRGLTNFANDGKAFVRLFENADFSTFAHESFHVMRRHLKPEDLKVLESEFGVKDGRWTVDAEEKSARAWERYLHDGVAPEPKLVELFRKMKEWMTGIYRTLADGDLEAEVSPAVRKVFNKMLTGEHEQMVKDREPLAPADIVKVPTQDLVLDPHRFQYKLNVNERGVTNALEGRVWNPELAGIISAWKDPADGKIYVINGHHRVVLAGENNVPTMNVQMIEADTAAEARSAGALQNIAEGHGTAIDAAKFFRDTGLTLGDLEKKGITITESKAEDGLALANLSQPIFDEVATGKMRVGRGVAIGSATEDHAQQEAVLKLIRKKENAGKAVSDAVVTELGRMAKSTKDKTERRDTLFGVESMTRNLLLEKAEVSEYIRKQIGQEKKLFGTVSSESAAQRLGKGGNVIEAEKNAEIANSAAQAQELYDRFSVKTGDINDILNRAADELADGENPNAVKQRAYEDTRTALSKTLGEGEERGAERVQENPQAAQADAKPPAGEHQGPVEDQGATLFQRKKPVHAETGPLLPGMEDVPEERKQALAEAEGETLTGELTQPKGDISRAAGEMEQKSPLFRGTEASPQNEMFGEAKTPPDTLFQKANKASENKEPVDPHTPLDDPRMAQTVFSRFTDKFNNWVSGEQGTGELQKAMMRQTRGEMDRALAVVANKLEGHKKDWVRRSREDFRKFAQAVEGLVPVDQLSPRDQELAKFFKQGFDEIRSQIQAVKPEALRSYIENYFPHIWKNPSKAEVKIKNVLSSKRPFAGSERFRQKRTVPTIEDGIDLGLDPISWNPVDMFLLKYKEEAQFLMAHKTLDMMKDNGTAKGIMDRGAVPYGWEKLDDRIGAIRRAVPIQTIDPSQTQLFDEAGKPKMAYPVVGYYYAPRDAATAFNAYVSRGLRATLAKRRPIYGQIHDIAQSINSNLNGLQLGISFFHATTTSVNAATSDIALGIQQMSRGDVFKGAGNVVMGATTLPSVIRTFRNGKLLMKEYLTPGSYAKFSREADAVTQAGGRLHQQTIELKKWDEWVNAWRNLAPKDIVRHSLGALIEKSVAPVMEKYVPAMKFGAFYNMAHDILSQSMEENWPEERTRARVQKAWDSIDNRFGQMVYDNLFWQKSFRDALMLSTRSVGWNYGTVRELGGGPIDLARQTARLATGKGNLEISDRLAFAIALPLYTALVGAVMTRLMTGKNPQTWKDYYYPSKKEGTKLNIPGYMKDQTTYIRALAGMSHGDFGLALQTIANKTGPLIEATSQFIQNRDFYGTEIRHKDDSPLKQMMQLSRWMWNNGMPFSITGSKKLLEKQGENPDFQLRHPIESTKEIIKGAARHPGDVALGQLGFQPAAAWIQHTPALNKAYGYQFENRPAGTRTSEQAEHHQYMLFLTDMFRKGNVDDKKIDKLIESGKILPEDVETAEKNSTVDPLELSARSLYLPQLLNVFAVASDQEKEMLRPVIAGKMGQLRRETDPDKRKQMIKALIKTGIIGSADEVGDEE